MAAEFADSFDKRPLKPETKLPKKAKQGQQPANPGPDVTYIETSAKSNKNIDGVSASHLIIALIVLILALNDDTSTGFPRHREKD